MTSGAVMPGPMRIGILGWGALGSTIGAALVNGAVDGAELTAISRRDRSAPSEVDVPVVAPDELAVHCDVVIEAATQDAVRDVVPGLLDAGTTVMVLSTGALRDQALFDKLAAHAGRRLVLSSGAIGGIDLLGACRHMGAINSVALTTTKPPRVLPQPWMDPAMVAALEANDEAVECFSGSAADAAEKFPTSVNVAATLALAAQSWDAVTVRVVGDPAATGNSHAIDIDADAGVYQVRVANAAMPNNPRSSALVVGAVLRGIETLAADHPRFI